MSRKRDLDPLEPPDRSLQPDLKAVLDRVGKAGYARATAADFAPGGKYSETRNRRPRYAIT